jgi:hypothetical protein
VHRKLHGRGRRLGVGGLSEWRPRPAEESRLGPTRSLGRLLRKIAPGPFGQAVAGLRLVADHGAPPPPPFHAHSNTCFTGIRALFSGGRQRRG